MMVCGRVLVCSASDSSGGAGIQADIKTITALGGYAMTAVTALTAQNTEGVFTVYPIPPVFIAQQMHLCLSDIGADIVKIGALVTTEAVETVSAILTTQATSIPVVVDPIMIAKDGVNLLTKKAVGAMITNLLPCVTLLTPNLPEALAFLKENIVPDTYDTMLNMAYRLLHLASTGPQAVLLKGGHISGQTVIDVLVTRTGTVASFTNQRIQSKNTHGTGCTLASAVSCSLSQGLSLEVSVQRAHAYVYKAILTAPSLGYGRGPINHIHTV